MCLLATQTLLKSLQTCYYCLIFKESQPWKRPEDPFKNTFLQVLGIAFCLYVVDLNLKGKNPISSKLGNFTSRNLNILDDLLYSELD